MKHILIDLHAAGHPVEELQPVLNLNGKRNIMTDDSAPLAYDLQRLIQAQFGWEESENFACRDYIESWRWKFKFGCNIPGYEFKDLAGKFIRDFEPAASYEIAPDESGADDAWFVCRAEPNGFYLNDSGSVVLAKSLPDSMLDDTMNAQDFSQYAILEIN